MTDQTNSSGMGFFSVLLIVFITLKLCGVIAWSWWWVLSPFWIPLCLALVALTIVGIVVWSK
jgi:hypothetical protein